MGRKKKSWKLLGRISRILKQLSKKWKIRLIKMNALDLDIG